MAVPQVTITTKVLDKAMRRDLRRLGKRIGPRVTASTLNRTGQHVESRAARTIAQIKDVPLLRVRWRYNQFGQRTQKRRLVRSRAFANRLVVGLWFQPRTISLTHLGARQTDKGVRAGTRFIPSAFISAPRAQPLNRQVFKRRTRRRYPIDVQKIELDPAAENVFRSELMASRPFFRKEFDRQMRRRLARR